MALLAFFFAAFRLWLSFVAHWLSAVLLKVSLQSESLICFSSKGVPGAEEEEEGEGEAGLHRQSHSERQVIFDKAKSADCQIDRHKKENTEILYIPILACREGQSDNELIIIIFWP